MTLPRSGPNRHGGARRGRRLAAAGLLAAAGAVAQPPAAMVSVDPVLREPLLQTVPVIGRLVARRSGNVAARVDGAIEALQVQVGDWVELGEVIARIDDQVLKARREQARARRLESDARLATSRVELELAKRNRDRLARLKDTQATSRAQLDDAVLAAAIAQARVREAKAAVATASAELELAEIDLGYAKVVAPYAGVIIQRMQDTGAYVRTGDTLVRMLADGNMEVEADVPFDRLDGLAPDTPVEVVLDDGTRHPARVRAVIPDENALTRTRAVRFVPDFASSRGTLAEGQAVTVRVPIGAPREVVTVHKDGVDRREGGASVYVVVDDVAVLRPVRLGQSVGERIEVLEGLSPGERVVVRGNERLLPNDRVRTAPASRNTSG